MKFSKDLSTLGGKVSPTGRSGIRALQHHGYAESSQLAQSGPSPCPFHCPVMDVKQTEKTSISKSVLDAVDASPKTQTAPGAPASGLSFTRFAWSKLERKTWARKAFVDVERAASRFHSLSGVRQAGSITVVEPGAASPIEGTIDAVLALPSFWCCLRVALLNSQGQNQEQ